MSECVRRLDIVRLHPSVAKIPFRHFFENDIYLDQVDLEF